LTDIGVTNVQQKSDQSQEHSPERSLALTNDEHDHPDLKEEIKSRKSNSPAGSFYEKRKSNEVDLGEYFPVLEMKKASTTQEKN
jgi:hypothetical protein